MLEVAQPLAYCLPGVRSRVVVSEGTLESLTEAEVAAILSHERAHLRARHDLVLEAFTAAHAAFPRFVRSASALDAVQLLVELLADDAAVRVAGRAPLARALVTCASGRDAVGCLGRRRCAHAAAGAPAFRQRQQPDGVDGRLPRRGSGAGGAHRRAGDPLAHRTAPAVHRRLTRRPGKRTRFGDTLQIPESRCATVFGAGPG